MIKSQEVSYNRYSNASFKLSLIICLYKEFQNLKYVIGKLSEKSYYSSLKVIIRVEFVIIWLISNVALFLTLVNLFIVGTKPNWNIKATKLCTFIFYLYFTFYKFWASNLKSYLNECSKNKVSKHSSGGQ